MLMHPDRQNVTLDEMRPIPTPPANEKRADGAQPLDSKQHASNEKPDHNSSVPKLPPAPPPPPSQQIEKKPPPALIVRAPLQWHKKGAKKPVKLPVCELLADGTFCGYLDKLGTQALCCFCCDHAIHCTE